MSNRFEREFRRACRSGRSEDDFRLPIDRERQFYIDRAHELRAEAYAYGIRRAAAWLASLIGRVAACVRRFDCMPPPQCPHSGVS